jgi:hypothetical protein
MKTDLLLSDEFVKFSTQIAELHAKKKDAMAAFKKVFEEHKALVKSFDEQAVSLQAEFDAWAAEKKKGSKEESQ